MPVWIVLIVLGVLLPFVLTMFLHNLLLSCLVSFLIAFVLEWKYKFGEPVLFLGITAILLVMDYAFLSGHWHF